MFFLSPLKKYEKIIRKALDEAPIFEGYPFTSSAHNGVITFYQLRTNPFLKEALFGGSLTIRYHKDGTLVADSRFLIRPDDDEFEILHDTVEAICDDDDENEHIELRFVNEKPEPCCYLTVEKKDITENSLSYAISSLIGKKETAYNIFLESLEEEYGDLDEFDEDADEDVDEEYEE